jgi:hypothetical protein
MFRICFATVVAAAVIGLGPAAQAYTSGMSLGGWKIQEQSEFSPQDLDSVAAVDPSATFQLIAQRRAKVGAVQTRMSVAVSTYRNTKKVGVIRSPIGRAIGGTLKRGAR